MREQPSAMRGGQLKEYQLLGVEWMVSLCVKSSVLAFSSCRLRLHATPRDCEIAERRVVCPGASPHTTPHHTTHTTPHSCDARLEDATPHGTHHTTRTDAPARARYNNHLNGILADEMGLGKTIQTIGPPLPPCPALPRPAPRGRGAISAAGTGPLGALDWLALGSWG